MNWLVFLFLLGVNVAHAQQLSRSQIVQTVENIEALSADEKLQLSRAENDYRLALTERNEALSKMKSETDRANLWEHRSEAIVEILAALIAIWAFPLLTGEIVRDFPAPWNFVVAATVCLALWVALVWGVNHVLDSVTALIPTPPSWEEVRGVFETMKHKTL